MLWRYQDVHMRLHPQMFVYHAVYTNALFEGMISACSIIISFDQSYFESMFSQIAGK